MNIRLAAPLRTAALLVTLPGYPLAAQSVGSLAAERARLVETTGDSLQLPTAVDPALADLRIMRLPVLQRIPVDDVPLYVVRPELRLIWNSALPYSLNDGPLWAGRGWSFSVNGGLALAQPYRRAILRVIVAPTLVYSQNQPFQVFPDTTPGRSAYANPFHNPSSQASLDLPHRFGDRHLLNFDLGRSGFAVEWPAVTIGATAAPQWWGPGIRNAIVMSNNAPGVPRWFVKTTRPIVSRLGQLDAQIISGTLTQSLFFSPNEAENRTLSGVLLQLRPAFDTTLTFGFTRVVYAPIGPDASPSAATLSRSFDALFRWENLAGVGQQLSDQIGSVFARWIFPPSGFEVYGEWARMDLPRNATELLTAAHHTGGWTFGFQWAQEKRAGRYLRLQSELTYLEQSRVFPDRPSPDFYSGQGSPHGYTQRGQIVGAAIGPGASSQWIAMDWIAPEWQAGGFVGRIRWDNDALYRTPVPTFWDHDVSMLAGLRGGWRAALTDVTAELTLQKRYNYLFQNGIARPQGRTVDVNNVTLALVMTPR